MMGLCEMQTIYTNSKLKSRCGVLWNGTVLFFEFAFQVMSLYYAVPAEIDPECKMFDLDVKLEKQGETSGWKSGGRGK